MQFPIQPESCSLIFYQSLSVHYAENEFLIYWTRTERAQLKLDATAVYTALGLNEKLFICTSSQVEQLVRIGMPSIHICFLYNKRENVITTDIFILVHTVEFGSKPRKQSIALPYNFLSANTLSLSGSFFSLRCPWRSSRVQSEAQLISLNRWARRTSPMNSPTMTGSCSLPCMR